LPWRWRGWDPIGLELTKASRNASEIDCLAEGAFE